MPQFDFYSFSGQCFWVSLAIFFFYFFSFYFLINQYSENLKLRQKLISFYTLTDKKNLLILKHL